MSLFPVFPHGYLKSRLNALLFKRSFSDDQEAWIAKNIASQQNIEGKWKSQQVKNIVLQLKQKEQLQARQQQQQQRWIQPP